MPHPKRLLTVRILLFFATLLGALAWPASAEVRLIRRWIDSRFSSFGHVMGSAGDFNGDGLGDFVIGFPYTEDHWPGGVLLCLGDSRGAFREIQITHAGDRSFGWSAACAGDLDADGFSDLMVGSQEQGAFIFRGGASADTNADLLIPTPSDDILVAPVGDWNADGFDDFAVAQPTGRGKVSMYFGAATLDGGVDAVLEGAAPGDAFGSSIAGGRDVNGDGYEDLVIGAPDADAPGGPPDAGEARVYFGGPGADTVADLVLRAPSLGVGLGRTVDLLADFNADGFSDVLLSGNTSGGASATCVFYGGPSLDAQLDWSVAHGGVRDELHGASAGDDVNRDHHSDIVAVGTSVNCLVYFGGADPDTNADLVFDFERITTGQRYGVFSAGDVDGDGYQEFFFASQSTHGTTTYSSAHLLSTHGSLLLESPAGAPYFNSYLSFIGGSPLAVQWSGAEIADLWYTPDELNWVKLASGVGGAVANSYTVGLPVRHEHRAHMAVVSISGTDSVAHASTAFTVGDPIETWCLGTRMTTVGVGVTWNTQWLAFPDVAHQFRLYRQDGGNEARVRPDPIVEDGWLDPEGQPGSIYRLVALVPGGGEWPLASVAAGHTSCDSALLIAPNGGERWRFGEGYEATWKATRPVRILLSRDDGGTWQDFSTYVYPAEGVQAFSFAAPATSHARLRVAVQGVGGAIWDDSDTTFQIAQNFDPPPPAGPTLSIGPSPGGSHESLRLSIRTPSWSGVPVSDVEVSVFDVRGHRVAILGQGLGAAGTVDVTWRPADLGLRPALYLVRVRSQRANFEATARQVVLN